MNPMQRAGAGDERPLHAERPPEVGHEDRNGMSLLTVMGFLFLTFNSGMAVYRSRGDYTAIAFVACSYVDLVQLFYCLKLSERTPPETVGRRRMKMAVWAPTTTLTGMFAYKVAAVMPLPAAVLVWARLVWAMAGAAGGFYAFFLHHKSTCPLAPLATYDIHLPEKGSM